MSNLSRRDAVKMVAGLGIVATGAGVIATRGSDSEAAAKPNQASNHPPAPDQQPEADANQIDKELKRAIENPFQYYFLEKLSFQAPKTNRAVFFTSAYGNPERESREERKSREERLSPSTMRVFRAITDQDDFTRQGGVYWKSEGTTGQIQFEHPGGLFLALFGPEGMVHCYSLFHLFKC
ncbi:hypothetical protein [Gimesia maris]|uniref:Uncharacterized protein n=1 Tax=Gimesia maris TaxID=122 RepID=A0ABX5YQP7_9PLAN|nr:hypothetical protein [Gimesia maris]EDL60345.1 hypothetical protein PM8797T_25146 [Gimesia maris DSM 8797]QEG17887.1 hypothetical protein GmarT_37710 [Gimesia maris]